MLHPTSATVFYQGDSNKTWTESLVTPTVLEGGCHIELSANATVYPAFMSGVGEGETDGGLHVRGSSVLYWRAKNSTYNGGTWLEGSGILALNGTYGDTSLGALPETPATNIWIMSGHTLFSESGTMSIHSNRTIFVKSGKTFNTGSQGRLVIGGEIKTEPSPGLDYTTNNLFQVRGDWAGTVVIGPGEGITNDHEQPRADVRRRRPGGDERRVPPRGGRPKDGRPQPRRNLERHGQRLILQQHEGASEADGRRTVLDAEQLLRSQQLRARRGRGRQDQHTPNSHWLMGLTGPSRLSVSNGGEFVVGEFRLGQTKACKNEMDLGKGGVIRPKKLLLEYGNDQDVTFNFDGGRFQSNADNDSYSTLFYASSHAKWDGVNFCVREGGAVLDSSFGKHVWWARPLVSGAEHDMFTTGTNFGSLQCRVADVLPGTTTLQIGPHTQVGFNSSWSSGHDLDQTVARVEGVGNVVYCTKLVVTNGIAAVFDGEYGTLTFGNTCSLAGDYTIVGNTNGCGCVKFNQNQDVSNLSLAFADVEKMDSHARSSHYKIVDAPNGITGTFALAADWPMNWSVKYASDRKSVYVYHQNGTQIIVR